MNNALTSTWRRWSHLTSFSFWSRSVFSNGGLLGFFYCS